MKPKVVQLAKFYPPEWGGIEAVTKDLAEGFAAAGFSSTVIAFTRRAPANEQSGALKIVRRRAKSQMDSQPISFAWFWDAVILGNRADTLIVQWPNVLAAIAVVFIRRPQILTFWHSDIIDKGIAGAIVRPLARYLLRRSSRILVNSPDYPQGSAELQPFLDKVSVLPIGIEDPVVGNPTALPAEIMNFLGGRSFALSVGRLVPYKGFDQLIEAARYLATDTALIIVGDGPLRGQLEAKIAELGVGDKVLIAGQLDRQILNTLFSDARLYVMCSVERSEAFGIVQVEAMAHSLPIVATDIPGSGVPWVSGYGATGALVPVRRPRALAEAIDEISTNAALGNLRRKSRQRYEEFFTASKMVAAAIAYLGGSSTPPSTEALPARRRPPRPAVSAKPQRMASK